MLVPPLRSLLPVLGCFLLASTSLVSPAQAQTRERISLDKHWRFALGNSWNPAENFNFGTTAFTFAKAGQSDGPASPRFDDRTWREVDVPHDWAVELPFDSRGDTNHGSKAIGRNFPQNSTGWYRKSLVVPASDKGRHIEIEFDGVYRDAKVWVNGFYLGNQPSGYTSFHFDVTSYLNYGGPNSIVVEADATKEEGWFYEGAGIYRHVWLDKTNPLHVAHDGTFVSTTFADPVTATAIANVTAEVTAQVTLQNDTSTDSTVTVDEEVVDRSGRTVAAERVHSVVVPAFGTIDLTDKLKVQQAHLWSVDDPYLHTLVTTVHRGHETVDRYVTTFGIRTVRFDADHGFFLNGKHVELQGTDDHQDHAGVGVALPDDLDVYRIEQLKALGSNAIRTSHNPPAPEFLDACDRLGMLVLDENRMMGTTPEPMGQLHDMIQRDRNHPSVIIWSVGNEEWAMEWSAYGERITQAMQEYARRLDPTRRSTIALSGSGGGNSLTTDVFGFNYYVQHHMDEMHKRFPDRPSVGTEESSVMHTRGTYFDDLERQHIAAYDDMPDPKHASLEDAWRYHLARPYSAGLFYWTGFDYRGETSPFGWPAISSQFGMLDTCGFFKDGAYLVQSWWTSKPMVHVLPHWSWPGKEGQPIEVRVYSNAAAVELRLNGTSLGKKNMPANSHLAWQVPYAPGKLEAQAYDAAGKLVAEDKVETTSAPARIKLMAGKQSIAADGTSLSVLTAEVTDAQGRLVPDASDLVHFELSGPGKILGVGNGDPSSHEADTYVATVHTIRISGWRTQIADPAHLSDAALQTDFDDSKWTRARDPRWDEHVDLPAASVFRTSFELTAEEASETLNLVLRSVGKEQTVSLNGKILDRNKSFDAVGATYKLEPGLVHAGQNKLAISATRFTPEQSKQQAFRWDDGGPAAIQAIASAPAWKRSVFHGLAQVIVQSTGSAGSIKLEAIASGLAPAQVEIHAVELQSASHP